MVDETQFLVWVKRKLAAIRTSGAINLVSSGVTTTFANEWLLETLSNRSQKILERSAEPNEFGLESLKRAIRSAFNVPAEREIVLTAGASGGIRLVHEILLAGRGDAEVVVESPVYQPILAIPERLGARIVLAERSRGIVAIAEAITDNTVAVWLTNLHNPTGHWFSHEELSDLMHNLRTIRAHTLVVVDETFGDIGPQPGSGAAKIDSRIVTISSLSKSHGLSSLRCGWVTADPAVLKHVVDDAVLFDNAGCKFMEVLGAMAVENIGAFRQAAQQHVARNRSLVAEWLNEAASAGLVERQEAPSGCIVFPRVLAGGSTIELARKLQEHFGVVVAPGKFFGEAYDDRIRIGFGGTYAALEQGLSRLNAGLQSKRR